jgi:hypothetical protein
MTVKEHYDNHLSKYYSWMAGDFTENWLNNEILFKRIRFNCLPSYRTLRNAWNWII